MRVRKGNLVFLLFISILVCLFSYPVSAMSDPIAATATNGEVDNGIFMIIGLLIMIAAVSMLGVLVSRVKMSKS